ncbi:NUDIX hydrolase domain-like protein [Cristinia sonorae]|uniref:Oxidized purine nucleoside triphosphate hydrolase n=1 Tax=Cristinia sonorae TaxID=1940300 RepID=A0A8K0UQT7_9AGAR|nr:NUDIX hydrolase domain-like protein [Cristinia sonorae]
MASELPPGITHLQPLVEYSAGGSEREWTPFTKIKQYTNAFIIDKQEGKILLGYKKRGIGAGYFNGFGGKVEPGETPAEAASRELQEEAGIDAPLRECGTLFFHVPGLENAFDIHIFVADEYSGMITETEEMRPQWFSTSAMPPTTQAPGEPALLPIQYDHMWADDIHWFPLLLANKKFAGRADFADDGKTLMKWWFGSEDS